ncbi:hypothetical protein GCM10022244_42010 [Streptomyces gulbargensis]|uniref:RNA polymerase sigma-70 region 4 domain-containing protein n=1 Tax=Streptomyces gulbargensis TaxID=364901 RepID=A0ABP7MTS3_9ACTN
MAERRNPWSGRRTGHAPDFEAFVAGAAGRLLHTATLLTAEPPDHNPRARALLTAALAHTYAVGDRLRDEDPYERARRDLAVRFARGTPRHRAGRGGVLARLTRQERLVVVLRLYEGVAEEQAAALLGLSEARVRAVCARSVAVLREAAGPAPAPGGRRANRPEDREAAVRRLLETPHPPVPAGLAARAAERGARLARRRRTAGRLLGTLGALAAVAFLVWASTARPWETPPAETTPVFEEW